MHIILLVCICENDGGMGIFEDADVQVKFSEITSAWVHEFGMMELSESKLICGVLTLKANCNCLENSPPHKLVISSPRYKWMTYGEAAGAREALGSGLVLNGIQKVRKS
jgi:hypothetical protein